MKKIILSLSVCFLYLNSFGQWSAQTSGTAHDFNAVYFVNSSTGYAATSYSEVFKTTDAGLTWSLSTTTSGAVYGLFFADANNGWAVGAGGTITKTSDGGTTWGTQSSGQGYQISSVFFLDVNTGFATTVNGGILKTNTGGALWSSQTSGTSYSLNGIYFIDANNGYAVGSMGTILNTTDGGTTWTAQTSGSGANLNSVYFTGPSTGFVCGQGGNMLYTVDGGANWYSTSSSTSNDLTSVRFVSPYYGYACGLTGTVIKTFDGGNMWYTQNTGSIDNLNGLFFTDINTGYAVGINGTILKTTDGGCTSPVVTVSGTSSICYGDMTTLTASGANSYKWDANGGNAITYTTSVTPLSNETVWVYGTSSNGCVDSASINITVNSLPGITTTPNDITCNGLCDGKDSVVVTGGTAPFIYSWSNGATTPGITNLCAGNYTITVTDAAGCISSAGGPIIEPAVMVGAQGTTNNATCIGINDGSIKDGTSGGTLPYTYLWMPGGQTSSTATNLAVGIYTVTVNDIYGCGGGITYTAAVGSSSNTVLTINGVSNLCQGESTQLTYTIVGGVAPFTYSWFDYSIASPFCTLDTAIVTPLVAGTDTIMLTVSDITGCSYVANKYITVNAGDSLSGTVNDINSNPVNSGQVFLFQQKLNHVGVYDTVGVTPISSTGDYFFKNVMYGDYFLKVEANTNAGYYPNAIGTYYSNKPNAYQWDSALLVNHYGCAGGNDNGYGVTILEITPQSGPGTISGYVTSGPGYGQRLNGGHNSVLGAPLKGVDVKLGKNPGGSPAARTTTDSTGNYNFTNIPIGQYKIYVDIPNYGMDSVLNISITSTNTVSTQNNYYVDSSMIRVDSCVTPTVTYTMVANAAPSTWDVFPTYSLTTSARWYWGDGTSTAGLYPSHTYAAAGKYTICVSVYTTCGDSVSYCQNDSIYRMSNNGTSSSMVQVNVVNGSIGIKNNLTNYNSLTVFPNPVTENVIIKSLTDLGLVTIYNSLGEIIFKEKINGTQQLIDLSKQTAGIYFIQTQGKYIKIVKE